jgi:quercetin dioxygenase-like cupin family protein
MSNPDWKTDFNNEISLAVNARREGNEGRARVCARRAAGIVIGEYISRLEMTDLDSSAYNRLKLLTTLPDIPDQVLEIANHLLSRVDKDHNLPVDADLIAEVRWLKRTLLNEKEISMLNPYIFISNLDEKIIDIPAESIVSRTIHDDEQVRVILFGFAQGQELSEHTASMPAIIHIIRGEAKLKIGNDSHDGQPGTWLHMPANLPHSVIALTETMMILTLIKNTG